jgi:hypothetical protein
VGAVVICYEVAWLVAWLEPEPSHPLQVLIRFPPPVPPNFDSLRTPSQNIPAAAPSEPSAAVQTHDAVVTPDAALPRPIPEPNQQSSTAVASQAVPPRSVAPEKPSVAFLPSSDAGRPSVYPSRVFAGPSQYPPILFKAYGIVAFPSKAAPPEVQRYRMVCEAYATTILHAREVDAPLGEQMTTVWPIDNDPEARRLNDALPEDPCENAVKYYGLRAAKQAIEDAKQSNAVVSGRGPYLLAWSPARQKGQRGALVLSSDLSEVTTLDQAKERFRAWSDDIEKNPDLWRGGWNMEKVRVVIRLWADRYGTQFLSLFGGEK